MIRHGSGGLEVAACSRKIKGSREDFPHPVSPCTIVTRSPLIWWRMVSLCSSIGSISLSKDGAGLLWTTGSLTLNAGCSRDGDGGRDVVVVCLESTALIVFEYFLSIFWLGGYAFLVVTGVLVLRSCVLASRMYLNSPSFRVLRNLFWAFVVSRQNLWNICLFTYFSF